KGQTLPNLLRGIAGLYPEEIEGEGKLLKEQVTGDFIVREDAPVEKVVSRLEEILRQERKLPVKLTFREVERKVIVARGPYRPNPLPGRQENQVDIYGKQLVENSGAGGGSGDFRDFLNWVGMFIQRRMVNEVEDAPQGNISWYYHRRSPFTEEMRK